MFYNGPFQEEGNGVHIYVHAHGCFPDVRAGTGVMVACPMCEQGQVILLGLDSNFTESNILGLLPNYTHT